MDAVNNILLALQDRLSSELASLIDFKRISSRDQNIFDLRAFIQQITYEVTVGNVDAAASFANWAFTNLL
jgi:hypothetical protein